jgi:UDP-N-acetylmuramoylalanine--D-glutamate ligase
MSSVPQKILSGERVLVVGLGVSGLSAAAILLRAGAEVVVNDARAEAALGDKAGAARALGATLALGGHDEALFTSVDRIVVSPGVPPLAALDAAEAAGISIASEIELASWFIESTVVAVTGTNGKSTVTTMIGEMCKRTGRPTFVGGNLGEPLTAIVGTDAAGPDGIAVVELSSFQLERVARFRAHVAVLLNVTEDHLDRYDTFASYAAAKGRIFAGQRREDAAVVPASDPLTLSMARASAATVHTFGGADGVVRVEGGVVVNGTSSLRLPIASLRIRGAHNYENACAAALAARLVGVDAADVRAALEGFGGLPHRMQHVRARGGVAFYDDSKATNVGASVAALDGLGELEGRVVLIAGGVDKGGSWAPLVERMRKKGRAVVVIGEATPVVEAAFEGSGVALRREKTMDDAVAAAAAVAIAGDVVLLAPACASFDMFTSYADRGRAFTKSVLELSALDEVAP